MHSALGELEAGLVAPLAVGPAPTQASMGVAGEAGTAAIMAGTWKVIICKLSLISAELYQLSKASFKCTFGNDLGFLALGT